MRHGLALSLLAACQRPEPIAPEIDTGGFSSHLAVVLRESDGWLGQPLRHHRAAENAQPLSRAGWAVAACLDVTRDAVCDPSSEPFAPCDVEIGGHGGRCALRPWKATLMRTQVFDGLLRDGALSLVEREHEQSIHAAFVAFETDGAPAPRAAICWSERDICSTATGTEPPQPLKLCGSDAADTVELELRTAEQARTIREPLPEPLVLSFALEPSGTHSRLTIDADRGLAQVLAQLREEASGAPARVLWTGAPRRSRADPSQVEISVPAEVLATLGAADRSLLVQLVAAHRTPVDDRLLMQRATEVRIWIRATAEAVP